MNRFKRGFILSLALFFIAVFVAGCNLFAQSISHDNNLIVAVVGDRSDPIVVIRKRQLRDAFNQWGFQFMQQGLDPRAAVEQTLEVLINREIMVVLSLEWFGELTEEEKARAYHQTFNSFDNQVRGVMRQIREERDMPDQDLQPEEVDDSVQHPTYEPHHPYIRVTQRHDGSRDFVLDLSRFYTQPEVLPTLGANPVADYVNQLFSLQGVLSPRDTSETEARLSRDTLARVNRFLRNREQGVYESWRLSDTDRDRRLVTEELERILEQNKQDILIQRFRDMHAQGVMASGVEYFQLFNNRFCEETVYFMDADGNDVEEEYATTSESAKQRWRRIINERNQNYIMDKVRRAEAQFVREVRLAIDRHESGMIGLGLDDYSAQEDSSIRGQVINNLSDVRFVPNEIVDYFFTVSHILIGFSEQQQNELRSLQAQVRNGTIQQSEYEARRDHMRNSPLMRQRDENGHEFGPMLTATEIMGIVEREVGRSGLNRINNFQRMIYAFNSDPGMINAQFEYAMGVDLRPVVNGERVGTDVMSLMVPEFTEASRQLYNFQNGMAMGSTGDWTHSASGMGQNNDGLVWSDFGAHIIMYTRPVSHFVFSNSATMLMSDAIEYMFRTQTSYSDTGRTFFDTILEGINRSEFAIAERALINTFRQDPNHGVTIFTSRFSDLW